MTREDRTIRRIGDEPTTVPHESLPELAYDGPPIFTDTDPQRTFLGYCLQETKLPESIDGKLKPEDFSENHRFIARAIFATARQGPCNVIAVAAEMEKRGMVPPRMRPSPPIRRIFAAPALIWVPVFGAWRRAPRSCAALKTHTESRAALPWPL